MGTRARVGMKQPMQLGERGEPDQPEPQSDHQGSHSDTKGRAVASGVPLGQHDGATKQQHPGDASPVLECAPAGAIKSG